MDGRGRRSRRRRRVQIRSQFAREDFQLRGQVVLFSRRRRFRRRHAGHDGRVRRVIARSLASRSRDCNNRARHSHLSSPFRARDVDRRAPRRARALAVSDHARDVSRPGVRAVQREHVRTRGVGKVLVQRAGTRAGPADERRDARELAGRVHELGQTTGSARLPGRAVGGLRAERVDESRGAGAAERRRRRRARARTRIGERRGQSERGFDGFGDRGVGERERREGRDVGVRRGRCATRDAEDAERRRIRTRRRVESAGGVESAGAESVERNAGFGDNRAGAEREHGGVAVQRAVVRDHGHVDLRRVERRESALRVFFAPLLGRRAEHGASERHERV